MHCSSFGWGLIQNWGYEFACSKPQKISLFIVEKRVDISHNKPSC